MTYYRVWVKFVVLRVSDAEPWEIASFAYADRGDAEAEAATIVSRHPEWMVRVASNVESDAAGFGKRSPDVGASPRVLSHEEALTLLKANGE